MSYLPTIPSRVIGSLGLAKIQGMLNYAANKQIRADEENFAADLLIAICRSIGITGSTDEESHEYKIAELEKYAGPGLLHYAGYVEDFVYYNGGGAELRYLNDIGAVGTVANAWADAIGVGSITMAAGVETGWGGADLVFDMQDADVMFRQTISALPVGAADVLRIGLWNGANDFVLFHCTDPTNPNPWTVEVMSGGVSQDSQVLTAVPNIVPNWGTFRIRTTPTSVTFNYNEGLVGAEEVTLNCVPPAVMADPRITVTSAAGGEQHYTDYVKAFARTPY